MRNELNDIEKIERYLQNEMSGEEKSAFEKEIQTNPDLKISVQEQRELMKGMERMKIKSDASKAKFKFQLKKGLINVGIPVLITAAITALALNWNANKSQTSNLKSQISDSKFETSYNLPSLNENGDSLWTDADKFIPYQIYSIDNSRDTIIEGDQGTILAIPANCFVDENGNVVKGKIDFELKEALNTETILKGGLTTTSNGELLETGGMFYLNARQDEKSLKLAEGKNIIADVPSDHTKTGMLLFDGERKEDGTINWVNPKPIEKPLVPVDIHSLNFYPSNYEDSLSAMTEKASSKKYKDSVYYSFAGRFGVSNNVSKNIIDSRKEDTTGGGAPVKIVTNVYDGRYTNTRPENISQTEGELLFNANCTSCHKPTMNYTGPALKGARQRWKNAGYKDKIYEWVQNPGKVLGEGNSYAVRLVKKFRNAGIMTAQPLSREEIDAIFDYVDNYKSYELEDIQHTFSGLNPAKVKAIWNDKFQSTLVATKEFEERMPHIHGLCSRGNNVLDIYVKNIDKRISTIDSMVAQTLSGSDRETFLKFAARGEGRVKTGDALLNKLGDYYNEQTKKFTEAAKLASENYYKKNREANENAVNKQNKYIAKNQQRESENFNREFAINLQDAYRQLGYKPVRVTGGIGVNVNSLGWKNVDKYVLAATTNRETMNYTDPFTGKTAVLVYEPLTVKIKGKEAYDRVLVYLLPDQLNSFMRMKKEDGNFSEKLNMLFQHEIIILAFKGDQGYFKKIDSVEPGEIIVDDLEKLSEEEINSRLKALNKLNHSTEMKNDIAYQFFQQKDAKRKAKFVKNEKIMRRIEKVIFPCGNYSLDGRSEEVTEQEF